MGLAYSFYRNSHKKIDMVSWLRHDAAAFKAHISAVFKGTVYWLPMTPKNEKLAADRNDTTSNMIIHNNNMELSTIFFPDSVDEELQWRTIDVFAINKGRTAKYYADELHFPGPLAEAAIYQVHQLMLPFSLYFLLPLLCQLLLLVPLFITCIPSSLIL